MPEEPEEQLEFLRREDIRTMAKDMARLREEESKKERERIIQLQGGSKATPPGQGSPAAAPGSPRASLMPSGFEAIGGELPRPMSQRKKILVRIAVMLLVLFVAANAIALAYSFWKKSAPQKTQTQAPEPTPPTTEPAAQQEESLLPFSVEKIVAVSSSQDITKLLSEKLPQGITRVSFDDTVQTPLALIGVNLSEQVRPLVRPSFLLFLHTLGEKKRFGLAFTIKGAEKIMKEKLLLWEPDMEKDTEPLFRLMNAAHDSGHALFFRATEHNDVAVRFHTLALDDLGIVYALSHNLLLITSSLESMNILLDALEKPAL